MARSNIKHFKDYSIVRGDIKLNIDMSRFNKQFQRAQYELDGNVMNSMIPFMPMQDGTFVNVTRAHSASLQGTGMVCAGFRPQGRYLYEEKVMVDSETGKGPAKIPTGPGAGDYIFRFRKDAKLVPTDRPLNYARDKHPKATGHWFDAAKRVDGKKWVKEAKKTAGGG